MSHQLERPVCVYLSPGNLILNICVLCLSKCLSPLCVCVCVGCRCVCVWACAHTWTLWDTGSASLAAKPANRNSSSSSSSSHGSRMERPLGSQAASERASATAKKKPWPWNPQTSTTHNLLNIFTFTTFELDMLVLIWFALNTFYTEPLKIQNNIIFICLTHIFFTGTQHLM